MGVLRGFMRVVFDLDFDKGAWPGPLVGKDAAIGEAWVGPVGFLHLLETALGLTGNYPSNAQRTAFLAHKLRTTDGFWSKSAEVDPIAAARRILSWRDELWLHGWRGGGSAGRLADLAGVARDLAPGIPDRILAAGHALSKRSAEVDQVEILCPLEEFPKAWRDVLLAMKARGTEIIGRRMDPVSSKGDLARLLEAMNGGDKFVPKGDGTLTLLRPYGVLGAADETAAWVASLPSAGQTVLISPDSALDAALRRFSLPTLGAAQSGSGTSLLAILPLVLDLGWSPQDPRRAFELLNLPECPVPQSLAFRLSRALSKWPAVGSDEWGKELHEALSQIEGAVERNELQERAKILFEPKVERGKRYPLQEIQKRLEVVKGWLLARKAADEKGDEPWSAAALQCCELENLLPAFLQDDFSEMELSRLVEMASNQVPLSSPYPVEAGLFSVGTPGSMAGGAERVVWWNFTLSSFSPPMTVPLTAGEKKDLSSQGIVLPSASFLSVLVSKRWRRALEQTTGQVLLVCPRRSQKGDEEYPHPFWDEIKAGLEDDRHLHNLERVSISGRVSMASEKRVLRPLPFPTAEFSCAPGILKPREVESPTSLIALMGCPLQYVLRNSAKLRGRNAFLPRATENVQKGNLAHHLIERLLLRMKEEGLDPTPEEARKIVEQWFEDETPRLAAELFLPGHDVLRANLKRTIGLATKRLVEILCQLELKVLGVEMLLDGVISKVAAEGKTDVLVCNPETIIDLKWSRASDRIEDLKRGAACQLAFYCGLRRQKSKAFPQAAYFIIDSCRLLSVDDRLSKHGERVSGPGLKNTWDAAERVCERNWAELFKGSVGAPGADAENVSKKSQLMEDNFVALAPPCNYCDYEVLCGRSFAEAES
jgi:ATP-dependent helicase/nuclease subunit B